MIRKSVGFAIYYKADSVLVPKATHEARLRGLEGGHVSSKSPSKGPRVARRNKRELYSP